MGTSPNLRLEHAVMFTDNPDKRGKEIQRIDDL
jgi:hypothetical protein